MTGRDYHRVVVEPEPDPDGRVELSPANWASLRRIPYAITWGSAHRFAEDTPRYCFHTCVIADYVRPGRFQP